MVSANQFRQGFLCGLLFCLSLCASDQLFAANTWQQSSPDSNSSDSEDNSDSEQNESVNKDKLAAKQQSGLVWVGAACVLVVGTIAILFVYFRMNLATRGFYAGRLQAIVALSFILLGALVFWVVYRFS